MAALTPLILLLASLQSAQDFDQKVTFTGKAMSIQSAISLLAKQTGVPLEPSGSLPEWHIYLHCTDQPLKDVMEKLGDTVYAEWVADQGKYFLRTSSKKLNVARQAQITINAAKLKKEIDKRLKDAASAPPMTRERAEEIAKKMREFQTDDERRDWKEYSKLQALDPSKSFTWQLLSRCNLREIAAIKPGERIVFALNPTPLQRQLDRTFVANRLPAFHRDFVEWGLANNQDGDVSPDQDAEQAKSMQEYRLQEEQKLRNFQCAEVLLTVTLERENPSYRISLGLFDANGDRAGRGFDQEYFSLANDGEDEQADMMKQAAPKDGEKKLELSQEEKDFGKMLMGAFDFGGRGEPKPPIKPAWRERMSNPDKFEPLSFGMSEVMEAYTAENGGQTLMVLPDIMVFMSGFAEIPGGPGDKISATGLIRSMQGFLGLNQQKTGNWVIVNSTDVDNALWGNRPRKELTRLFASLNGSNAAEAWQEYTASVDGMPFYDMGYLFGAVLMGQSPDFGMNQQNSMGPIYYALTKDQRTQLRNGVPIAVGGLTPAQKEKVRFLTYGAKSLYKCVTQDVVDSYSKMDAAQQLQNSEYLYQNGGNGLYIQNLREDPTVSLPTGLPDRAVIVARPISKQVVAVFDNPEGTGYSYDQDTYSIAWDLFQHERPELFPGENNRKASYYRLGQKQVLHMRVDFDKTRALYGSIELMATGTKEKPVPFDKLPDSVKKEALEQVKQYRESYKDAKPGQFGGGRGSIPKP